MTPAVLVALGFLVTLVTLAALPAAFSTAAIATPPMTLEARGVALPAGGSASRSSAVGGIEHLVLPSALPGMAVAPPGPENGPLQAGSFASFAPDPAAVMRSFVALSTKPGFSSWERAWYGRNGDVLEVLLRFPASSEASHFAAGFAASVRAGSPHMEHLSVPGVPGAFGASITLPVLGAGQAPGRLQVVVLTDGPYASEVTTGTSLASSNTSPIPSGAVVGLARRQYALLQEAIRRSAPKKGGLPAVLLYGAIALVAVLALAGATLRMSITRRSRTAQAAAGATGTPGAAGAGAGAGATWVPSTSRAPGTWPAGWYPDPVDPEGRCLRYFDGEAWTTHVAEPEPGAGR